MHLSNYSITPQSRCVINLCVAALVSCLVIPASSYANTVNFVSELMRNGQAFQLRTPNDQSTGTGRVLSKVGDFNGDTVDDLVLLLGNRVLLLFGGPNIHLLSNNYTLDGKNGVLFTDTLAMMPVVNDIDMGDINNDGFDDILLGIPSDQSGLTTPGKGVVIYGSNRRLQSPTVISALGPGDVSTITGQFNGDGIGQLVSADGDLSGDGKDDVTVCGRGFNPAEGAVATCFVLFGSDAPLAHTVRTDHVVWPSGQQIQATRSFPLEIYGIDPRGLAFLDYNGDGSIDLIGSSLWFSGPLKTGVSSFSADLFSSKSLTNRAMRFSAIGDINDDGREDLGIASTNGGPGIVFGSKKPPDLRRIADIDDRLGLKFKTLDVQKSEMYSNPVGVGDVNGDGADDFVVINGGLVDVTPQIVDYYYTANVILGSRRRHTLPIDFNTLSDKRVRRYRYKSDPNVDTEIRQVLPAGDINADGYDDMIFVVPGRNGFGELNIILGHGQAGIRNDNRKIALSIGEKREQEYGFGYGSNRHPERIRFRFNADGESTLLTFNGFDINSHTELAVRLNGKRVGQARVSAVNSLSGINRILLPAGYVDAGNNILDFAQRRYAGQRYGVTNVRLQSIGGAARKLPILSYQTTDYGYGFKSYPLRRGTHYETRLGRVTFDFENERQDLLFSVRGFDIDTNTEAQVFLNGQTLGYLNVGKNNAITTRKLFVIPLIDQQQGTNSIDVVQAHPGSKWGVTRAILWPLEGPDSQLEIGVRDERRYGFSYLGSGNKHLRQKRYQFSRTTSDLKVTVKGFDIDTNNEVAVLFNGTRIGNMKSTKNNEEAWTTFTLYEFQQTDSNVIEFRQRQPGTRWGVSRILIRPQ